ncbi:MAG: hypothetical protein PHS82_16020 [Lachnospiraceae bacterium]|nr:hypothetical protein [Lachnospiraceae bacterium]
MADTKIAKEIRKEAYLRQSSRVHFLLLLTVLAAVLLWQGILLLQVMREDRGQFGGMIENESGITAADSAAIAALPGSVGLYPVTSIEAELHLGNYVGAVTVQGVDFDVFPLTMVPDQEAEDAEYGRILLLDTQVLAGLQDPYGNVISKREVKELEKNYRTIGAKVTVGGADTDPEAPDPSASHSGRQAYEVQIPGLLSGDAGSVYMDQNQVKQMQLQSGNSESMVTTAWIQMQGLDNMTAAEEKLQQAGYTLGETHEQYQAEQKRKMTDYIRNMVFAIMVFFCISVRIGGKAGARK